MVTFAVESWGADYGSPMERTDFDAEVAIDAGVEFAPDAWQPIPASGAAAPSVLFIDGVRRIDARIWVTGEEGTRMGICASFAAGTVRCDGVATITDVAAGRGAFAPAELGDIDTICGRYDSYACVSERIEDLTGHLQRAMGELEETVARRAGPADLIVLDGPTSGREDIPGAIGYVKSHRVDYLDPACREVVSRLEPGERSPLFLIESIRSRFSWYLRLPGGTGHPWAGIVRCEAAGTLPVASARSFADLSAATIPRYASAPFRDPRAPQNLYPIAGLEQELRHRLGDAGLLDRALRIVASQGGSHG
jgi:hypothetical protein